MKVGDEVVLGAMVNNRFHPIQHNSKHSPNHPCRGVVTKITETFTFITSTGTDWRIRNIPLEGHRHDVVLPLEQGKQSYRDMLETNEVEPELLNQYVGEL